MLPIYMYRRSGSADLPAIKTGVNGIHPALLQVEEALCTMALWGGGGGTTCGHFSIATHDIVLYYQRKVMVFASHFHSHRILTSVHGT